MCSISCRIGTSTIATISSLHKQAVRQQNKMMVSCDLLSSQLPHPSTLILL